MNQLEMVTAAFAALYGRVSTDKQTSSTQQVGCRAYIDYKKLPLAEEFYDDDVSGSILLWDRPGGARLRERIKQGGIKHLVVAKLDRLGRKATHLLDVFNTLDDLGVVLHIVDFGGDSLSTQGPAGRMMLTILAAFAQFELEMIQDRITKHMAEKRGKGELLGTQPYGWDSEVTGEKTPKGVAVKRLLDNLEEQKWILFMVDLRRQGFGYHTIAKRLNALGVPTKRRGEMLNLLHEGKAKGNVQKKFTSGKWQSGNVMNVLNNKTVLAWLAKQQEQQQKAA